MNHSGTGNLPSPKPVISTQALENSECQFQAGRFFGVYGQRYAECPGGFSKLTDPRDELTDRTVPLRRLEAGA